MSEQDSTLGEFVGDTTTNDEQEDSERRLPEIDGIPGDWELVTIEDIANDLLGGGTPSKSNDEYWSGTIPWASVKDLDGIELSDTEDHITEIAIENSTTNLIPANSIIISTRMTVGEPFLNQVDMAINQDMKAIIPDQERANTLFLVYSLWDNDPYLKSLGRGTTVDGITTRDLSLTHLGLPSIEEQREIATVLYTVDQAIEKTEEIIDKYQSIISGIIQDIATTGINNQNLEEQKVPMLPERWEIPKHWKLEFLENITTLITDGAHITPTYVENGMPFLKVENIKQEKIEWDSVSRIPEEEHNDLIKSGNPTKGDILLSKNGTIGITKVVDWDREFSHFVSLALIRPKQDIILSDYLSTLLESQICMRQAEARSKTGTVTNLHLEEIEKLSIPVPPISEQKEILEKISAVEDCLSAEMRYLNRLQRLKQGLMQDLLSGTVRTTDTNITVPDEVAQHG